MKKDKLLNTILFLLALHLLYSNSVLLQSMVKNTSTITQIFSLLFGMSYSLMTVLIISVYPRWYVYSISAFLDGIAVLLKYFPFSDEKIFFVLSAIYFSLYTAFIVVISGMIARRQQIIQQISPSNGKPNIEELLQKRAKIKWALDRTKNEQAREQRLKELEDIDRIIKSIQN